MRVLRTYYLKYGHLELSTFSVPSYLLFWIVVFGVKMKGLTEELSMVRKMCCKYPNLGGKGHCQSSCLSLALIRSYPVHRHDSRSLFVVLGKDPKREH